MSNYSTDALDTGLILPIRFYDTIEEQDRYKPHAEGVALTELNYPIVDSTSLAPFQLAIESPSAASINVYVYNVQTGGCIEISPTIYTIQNIDGITYIYYTGTDSIAGIICGLNYLKVVVDGKDYYSDYFYAQDVTESPIPLKIMYWNSYDIIGVRYENGYTNSIWLNVNVKKPNYVVTRETYENSRGELVNEFIKWEKQHQFTVFCTEPLADALTAITLHDNVYVTLPNGNEAKVKDFTTDVKWTAIENIAEITCTFTSNSYIVNGQLAANCV